jgi:hypothetical protein
MLLGTLRRRGGRAALLLLVGMIVGGAIGAATVYVLKRGKAGIAGGPRLGEANEMSLVPAEAAGFVHIRVRALWDTEAFAEARKIIDAAGPQAKATLDESFVPAPSTIDRVTLVFVKAPAPVEVPKDGPKGPGVPPKKGPRKNAQRPAPPVGGGFAPPRDDFDFLSELDKDMKVVVLLAFNAPYDAAKIRSAHLKDPAPQKQGEREYWEDPKSDVAVYFPSDTVLALGDIRGMKAYMTKLSVPTGPLAGAIEHAQKGGRHFVAAVNLAHLGIPLKVFDSAPEDAAKHAQAVMKAESLMLGVAVTEEGTKVDVRARYKDAAAAAESEAALRALAALGRTKLAEPKKQVEAALNGPPGTTKPRPIHDLPTALGGFLGLGAINSLDEWLADPPLKTDGPEVVLTPKVPSLAAVYAGAAAATVGLMVPAVQKVQVGAGRMKDVNNLRQLGIAMQNYHDQNNRFPPQDGKIGPDDKGGLSWRVHLLPHIGQENLYKRFKLDEPWDSEHNKPLVNLMPVTYASPLATDPAGQTRYKVFSSPEAVVYPGSKTKITDLINGDGTSKTVMIVGGGKPVIWTKPDDIEVTVDLTPAVLALPGQTGCNVVMCDGSEHWLDLARLTPKTLRAAITRAGGDTLGPDW